MQGKFRIEVAFREQGLDAESNAVLEAIKEDLLIENIEALATVSVFTLEGKFSEEEVQRLASGLFADPITHEFRINSELGREADWVVEVALLPGVTDNVAIAAEQGIRELLGRGKGFPLKVKTLKRFYFKGALGEKDLKRIGTEILSNPLIESFKYVKNHRLKPVA